MNFISLLLLITVAFTQSNEPNWTINPADFQFTANFTSQAYINFSLDNDSRNKIGAFYNGELRGFASPSIINSQAYYFLTVYSNTQNDSIEFKIYDASADTVLNAEELYIFVSNDLVGSSSNPYQINGKLNYDHPPELAVIPNQSIESTESFSAFSLSDYLTERDGETVVWTASESSDLTISIDEGTNVTITLVDDEWVGEETVRFTATDQSTNQKSAFRDVLFKVSPEDRAPILSAIDDQITGLFGEFETIDLSTIISELDGNDLKNTISFEPEDGAEFSPTWTVNPNTFTFSMAFILKAKTNGLSQMSANQKLGAFVDSELRGVASPVNLGNGNFVYFLTVYSNTNFEEIKFKIYEVNKDDIYPAKESYIFEANKTIGSASNPVNLNAGFLVSDITNDLLTISINDTSWFGTSTVTLISKDIETSKALADTTTFQLEIKNDHVPKILTIPNQKINYQTDFIVLNLLNYEHERDAEDVMWSVSGESELTIDITNKMLTVTKPNNDWVGKETLTLTLTDQTTNALSSSANVIFQVTAFDNQPSLSEFPDLTLARNDEDYSFDISNFITELDGDEQAYLIDIELEEGIETKPNFSINGSEFSSSFSMSTIVRAGGKVLNHDDAVLSAYNGEELRGFAEQVQLNDTTFIFFLTVYGETNDTINFKIFDPISKNTLDAQNEIVFKPGEVWGTPSNPYAVTADIFKFEVFDLGINNQILKLKKNALDWHGSQEIYFITYDKNTELNLADTALFTINVLDDYRPDFIEISEQIVFRGNDFQILELDSISILLDADEVDYQAIGSTNLNAIINENLLTVSSIDQYWVGTDSIQLIATDQTEQAFSKTLSITFSRLDTNTAPIIVGISNITFDEDMSFIIDLTGKALDAENDEISWQVSSQNTNILIDLEGDNLTISATENYNNDLVSLTFYASDPFELIDSINIDLTITAINDAPIWLTLPSIIFNEDESYTLILSDYINDVDGDLSHYTVSTENSFVNLTIIEDSLTFSASAHYFTSSIPFTLTAHDEEFDTETNHSFSIASINDAPVLSFIPSFQFSEDDSMTVDLASYVSDADHSDNNLSWTISNLSSSFINYALEGSTLTLKADKDFNGSNITFDVLVQDPENGLDRKIVTLNVLAVSDPPIWSTIDPISINEDETISLFFPNYITDIDGGTYAYTASSADPNIIFENRSDSLIISATTNYFASETSFELTIQDEDSIVPTNSTITINSVNDLPLITEIPNIVFLEDDSTTVDLSAYKSDVEDSGNDLTWSVETADPNLILSITDDLLKLKGNANYATASTSITVILTDLDNGESSQNIDIEITDVNDAPIIIKAIEDNTLDKDITNYAYIKLSDYFYDSDQLLINYELSSSNADVTVTISNDTLYLSTNSAFSASATITITAKDSEDESITQNFDVSFRLNTIPVELAAIADQSFDEDFISQSIALLSDHFTDVNGDSLRYFFPTSSLVEFSYHSENDSLSISAIENQNGSENITFTVSDGSGGQIQSQFQITINAVDDAPIQILPFDDIVKLEDTAIDSIFLEDYFTDIDSEISFSVTNSNEAVFVTVLRNNYLVFETISNANGISEIGIQAESNELIASDAFNITISAVDDEPYLDQALANITVDEDASIASIYLPDFFKDSDTDESAITFLSSITNSSLLTASITGDSLMIQLLANAYGTSDVIIRMNSNGKWISDTLTLTVNSIDDPLVQIADFPALNIGINPNDTTWIIGDYYQDLDNAISYEILSNTSPERVTAILNNDLIYFQFSDSLFGVSELVIQVTSNSGSRTDTIKIEIIPDNYPPELLGTISDITVDEDATIEAIALVDYFFDRDTDQGLWNFSVSNSNTSLSNISIENDSLYIVLNQNQFGTANIELTLESESDEVSDLFILTVNDVDDPLIQTNNLPSIMVDENADDLAYALLDFFQDVDNTVSFSILESSNQSLLSEVIENDSLKINFDETENGSAFIIIQAITNEQIIDTLFIQVNAIDNAPYLTQSIPDITVDEDTDLNPINLLVYFDDIDSESEDFIFELTNDNNELLNAEITNSILDLELIENHFGGSNLTITVTVDGKSVSDSLTITVNSVNDLIIQNATIDNLVLQENPNDTIIDLSSYIFDVDDDVIYSIISNSNGTLIQTDILGDSLILNFANERVGLSEIIIKAESDSAILDTFSIQLIDNTSPVISVTTVPSGNDLRINLTVSENLFMTPTITIEGTSFNYVKTTGKERTYHYVYNIVATKRHNFLTRVVDKGGNQSTKAFELYLVTRTSNNSTIQLSNNISMIIPIVSIDQSNVISISEVNPDTLFFFDDENETLELLSGVFDLSTSKDLIAPLRFIFDADPLNYSNMQLRKVGLYIYDPLTETWLHYLVAREKEVFGALYGTGRFAFFYNENYVAIPNKYSLVQNYPNPFNPTTTIEYHLPKAVKVTLAIYNILGQKVRTLVSEKVPAGYHEAVWDGRNRKGVRVASGVYYYQLISPSYIKTKKMVLVK